MKKIYFAHALVGCFLFLCIHKSTAQTLYPFPSPGLIQTEVYNQDWTQMFAPRNHSFVHTGDTIVGSYTYSRFSWLPVGSSNPWYTHYDSGSVYYTNNSTPSNPLTGVLLYDFNLGVGDTFAIGSIAFGGTFTVDLVSTATLPNTQTRKYIRLVNGTDTLEWIDGIGDINRGFFYNTDFQGGYEELVCIQDSTGPLYNVPDSPFYCDPYDPIPTSGPNTCDQFAFNAQVYGTSCVGCDGAVTISNVTGGTPGYTYSWSNGATTPSVSNLCQGPITVTIYDAAGDSCSRTFMVGLNQINLNMTHGSADCIYYDTICVTPTGGNAPYTYVWSEGSTTPCIVVTSNGTYTIQVWDANGCSSTQTITINNPQPLSVSSATVAPTCSTCCDGTVTLNISGGIPPYAITGFPVWPASGNFCAGWYDYCVTDSLDCMWCDSIYLEGPLGIAGYAAPSFILSPNPAQDVIHVDRGSGTDAVAVIRDLNGKMIREYHVKGPVVQLDVAFLSEGIYFLSLDGYSQKLVIVRDH